MRLRDLCSAKDIIKKKRKGEKILTVKNKFSVLRRNVRIIALIMLWLAPTSALAYAMMMKITIKGSSELPIAYVEITPDTKPNVGWELNGSKIIAGETMVTFNASGSYDPDGEIKECIWEFGDGEHERGVVARHVYSKPGKFCARLTIIDDEGNKVEKYREIIVYAKPKSEISLSLNQDGRYLIVFIIVKDVNNLYGWQAGLQFNPEALKCLTVEKGCSKPNATFGTTYIYSEGLFSGSDGSALWFAPTIDNKNGVISLMSCTLLGDSPPASGSGILAVISFEILSDQSYNLELNNVILCTRDGEEIPVLVKH